MKRTLGTAVLVALGAGVTGEALADSVADRPYVSDARNDVARSGFGLCWHTGYWTPAAAAADAAGCACDRDLLSTETCEAPVAKPAPLPAAVRNCDFTVSLRADQVFEFNTSALRPTAAAALDRDVVSRLATCAEVKFVGVTGHSDRLGDPSYNQKLSERRADVVKAYLVRKGVREDVIDTMGAGKTQPVPGVSCPDGLSRQKMIACLAPNRRAVIEVRGPAK